MQKTPLKFWAEVSAYVVGTGYTTEWQEIKSKIILGGVECSANVFWCDWQSAFGKHVLDAQAVGVSEMATVRMTFIPDLYDALRGSRIVIAKNVTDIMVESIPNKDNVDAYEVFGGVDNVKEENKLMEFKVRRYEPK